MNANNTTVTAAVGAKAGRRLVLHFDLNKTILMKDSSNNLHNTTLTVNEYYTDQNLLGLQSTGELVLGSHVG
jgi:hypothetical protein